MKLRTTLVATFIGALIASTALVTSPAFAQRGERPDRPERAERPDRDERLQAWGERSERPQAWGDRGARGEARPQPESQRGPGPQGPLAGEAGPGQVLGQAALRPFWTNERIAQRLDLSDDQIAALKESLELTQDQIRDAGEAHREAAKALADALQQDNPELQAVYDLHDKVAAARDQRARAVLGHVVTVKNVLTAEQEKALKQAVPQAVRDRVQQRDELSGPRGWGADQPRPRQRGPQE